MQTTEDIPRQKGGKQQKKSIRSTSKAADGKEWKDKWSVKNYSGEPDKARISALNTVFTHN